MLLGNKMFFCFCDNSCIIHKWLVCLSQLAVILNGKEQATGLLGSFKKTKKEK